MRNRYLASFIIAIVVLAAAAALITVGLVQITPKMCTQDFGCFGSMQVSCYRPGANLGYVLIFLGGVCVIAGILLFILSEVIRSHEECCDCCDADFIDTANSNCNCDCSCSDNKDEEGSDCCCCEKKD